jgi:hypothetical protein
MTLLQIYILGIVRMLLIILMYNIINNIVQL